MNAVSIIGFIIGFGLIAWVLLANAEASPQWYGDGDRELFTLEMMANHENIKIHMNSITF